MGFYNKPLGALSGYTGQMARSALVDSDIAKVVWGPAILLKRAPSTKIGVPVMRTAQFTRLSMRDQEARTCPGINNACLVQGIGADFPHSTIRFILEDKNESF